MFLSRIPSVVASVSVAGLLTLLVAVRGYRLSRSRTTPRALWCAAGWIALILLATLCSIALSRMHAADTPWPRCRAHVKRISVELALYTLDHDGTHPPDLATLAREMQLPHQLFVCPYSGRTAGDLTDLDTWSDYRYSRVAPIDRAVGDIAVLACRPENHDGKGTYVLHNNLELKWVPLSE